MKIIKNEDGVTVKKQEGTNVTYFLFDEYEIHYNEQAPGSTQLWHHHESIWETIYLIEGKLTVKWKDKDKVQKQIIRAGDLVEVENTSHTFTNYTNKQVKFLVMKQVLEGKNYASLMRKDKIIDE